MTSYFRKLILLLAISQILGNSYAYGLQLPIDKNILPIKDEAMFYIDQEGNLDLEDLSDKVFAPTKGIQQFGTDRAAVWIKLNIVNPSSKELRYFFEVDNPLLTDIRFYHVREDSTHKDRAGNVVAFNERSIPYIKPLFKLEVSPQSSSTAYFRIESYNTKYAPINLITEEHLVAAEKKEQFAWGIYLGIILAILFINLLNLYTFRDSLYGYYCLILVALHLTLIPHVFGTIHPYLFPNTGGLGMFVANWAQVALTISFLMFTQRLFSTNLSNPWFSKLSKIMISASVCFFLKEAIFGYHFVDVFVMPLIESGIILMIAALMYKQLRRGDPLAKIFLLAWACLLGGSTIHIAMLFVHSPVDGRAALIVGALLEANLLSLAAHNKIKTLQAEHLKASTRIKQLRKFLNYIVPSSLAEQIVNKPEILSEPPKSQIITIMFIDMVAYSKLTESKDTSEVFLECKRSLDQLKSTIKKYDGIIDRSLGDGLLCFFGYQDDTDHSRQVIQAISCANEIQNSSIKNLSHTNLDGINFSYRIGINTDQVSIGNMGSQDAPDFTVAGHGVVLASRLETSCDPFKILVGEGSRKLIEESDIFQQAQPEEKWIQVKHNKELIRATEVIPSEGSPENLHLARMNFYRQVRAKMQHPRIDMPESKLKLSIAGFPSSIINYSYSGLGVISDQYWGRNLVLTAHLSSSSPQVQNQLELNHLDSFKVVVRWGLMLDSDKFRHGLAIDSLNNRQLEQLMRICEAEIISQRSS